MDLLLQYNNALQQFDYVIDPLTEQFIQTRDIETLIQIQLFTNQSDIDSNHLSGWWGDAYSNTTSIGSKLWTLKYHNQTEYEILGKSYTEQALTFLTDYGLCDGYVVTTSYTSPRLTIQIEVTKNNITTTYNYVWNGE